MVNWLACNQSVCLVCQNDSVLMRYWFGLFVIFRFNYEDPSLQFSWRWVLLIALVLLLTSPVFSLRRFRSMACLNFAGKAFWSTFVRLN